MLALGTTVEFALKAYELLRRQDIQVRVVNMRFAKPPDGALILDSLAKTRLLFTLEEHVLTGGFGSKVLEFLERQNVNDAVIHRLALPDQFIEHGDRDEFLAQADLSPEKIAMRVLAALDDKNTDSLPPETSALRPHA